MSNRIQFDDLCNYFHLPINQVASQLGICVTVIKKICRRNGVTRWPHRKIKSLDRMIKVLEMSADNAPENKANIQNEIELFKKERASLMRSPLYYPTATHTIRKHRNSSTKKWKPPSPSPSLSSITTSSSLSSSPIPPTGDFSNCPNFSLTLTSTRRELTPTETAMVNMSSSYSPDPLLSLDSRSVLGGNILPNNKFLSADMSTCPQYPFFSYSHVPFHHDPLRSNSPSFSAHQVSTQEQAKPNDMPLINWVFVKKRKK